MDDSHPVRPSHDRDLVCEPGLADARFPHQEGDGRSAARVRHTMVLSESAGAVSTD